jgi:hypothetical protein
MKGSRCGIWVTGWAEFALARMLVIADLSAGDGLPFQVRDDLGSIIQTLRGFRKN